MKYVAWIDDKQHEIEVELKNGAYSVRLDGKRYDVDARRLPRSSVYSMLIGGKSYEADVTADGDSLSVSIQGEVYRISLREELWAKIAAATGTGPRTGTYELRAPMPGLVVDVRVSPEQRVTEGQPLVVVEAMKMQNEICAPSSGVVKKIGVKQQDIVDPDRVLVVIERDA
jgi:biotin carboxyl carrier protein